jgi:hypothetical protein
MAILIGQATNSRGLKISITPKSLIIPVNLQFEAARILKSVGQNDTANNAINAMKSMGTFSDGFRINHYLTDTDAWYVRTNVESGLRFFQRKAVVFAQDGDFDTSNIKYKASERYSVGWSDWRGLYGSPGA